MLMCLALNWINRVQVTPGVQSAQHWHIWNHSHCLVFFLTIGWTPDWPLRTHETVRFLQSWGFQGTPSHGGDSWSHRSWGSSFTTRLQQVLYILFFDIYSGVYGQQLTSHQSWKLTWWHRDHLSYHCVTASHFSEVRHEIWRLRQLL